MDSGLCVRGLSLQVEEKTILRDFSLAVPGGEMHALLGPNGAGKSSLSKAIAGHPDYRVLQGDISFDGNPLCGQSPDSIARMGIFLAFQNPVEIEGLSVANFLRAAVQAHQGPGEHFSATEFYAHLYRCLDALSLEHSFSARSLNVGFSGGEKKRCELLQMLMLHPRFALLDEIDSGLDADATKTMAHSLDELRRESGMGGLIITHHPRLLQHLRPDRVHILLNGRIVRSGHQELIERVERSGYSSFISP
ncbi:MAG: Fe-S cluster assembly ATPase SufC [Puniceicoccales bacterium]|nr:Fe-S cluster assembly ATPase SufC [Puniceicoccales bacterium]